MEKLKKTAVIIDKVLKVFFIIILVCAILLVASDILIFAVGPMNIENGEISYSIGGMNFIFVDGLDIDGVSFNGYQFVKGFLMASAGGAVGMIVILVGIKMLREIIAPMKEGGPFVEGISIKMRNFGIFVLIAGIVGSIIEGLMALAVQSTFNEAVLEEFIGSADRITYMHIFDGGFIIFALFIFLLSYIFNYGEELQKQADETL